MDIWARESYIEIPIHRQREILANLFFGYHNNEIEIEIYKQLV